MEIGKWKLDDWMKTCWLDDTSSTQLKERDESEVSKSM